MGMTAPTCPKSLARRRQLYPDEKAMSSCHSIKDQSLNVRATTRHFFSRAPRLEQSAVYHSCRCVPFSCGRFVEGKARPMACVSSPEAWWGIDDEATSKHSLVGPRDERRMGYTEHRCPHAVGCRAVRWGSVICSLHICQSDSSERVSVAMKRLCVLATLMKCCAGRVRFAVPAALTWQLQDSDRLAGSNVCGSMMT
jgi:hypothetical protein